MRASTAERRRGMQMSVFESVTRGTKTAAKKWWAWPTWAKATSGGLVAVLVVVGLASGDPESQETANALDATTTTETATTAAPSTTEAASTTTTAATATSAAADDTTTTADRPSTTQETSTTAPPATTTTSASTTTRAPATTLATTTTVAATTTTLAATTTAAPTTTQASNEVKPGAFCSPVGATGTYNGRDYVCSTTDAEGKPYDNGRARWRRA